MVKKISILGTRISLMNWENVISEIDELLRRKKQIFITTPNPEHIIEAWENKDFQNIINESDLAIPDGIGLVWAMRRKLRIENGEGRSQSQFFHTKYGVLRHDKLKKNVSEQSSFVTSKHDKFRNDKVALKSLATLSSVSSLSRVTGVDLMEKIVQIALERKWKVGLLGGKQDVGRKVMEKLREKYKGLKVELVGSHRDVMNRNEEENKEIIQNIKKNQIDVLFVAYGAPKQELIISEYIKLLLKVKIFMGVGGSFDFISGELIRAPKWIQKIGLEWMFRLIQEPWRLKRQLRLFKFVWLVIKN